MRRTAIAFGLSALVAMLGAANAVYGYTLNVNFSPGTTQVTTALTGFSTFGDMMDGMEVTAYFVGGGSETALWGTTGAGAGGAFGTGWSLVESGDTWTGLWTLSTTPALRRLYIDAGTGDAVFDIDWDPYPGTVGSADGHTFTVSTASDPLNITVIYRDLVALTGDPPVGDLYRRLDINFRNLAGFTANDTLVFQADTDNLLFPGDITAIPEPATLILVGLGLGGLALKRRRRA